MSGRKWLDGAHRVALARAVRQGRANGVPWKVLARVYGRSIAQLKRDIGRNEPSFSSGETNEPSAVLIGAATA